MDDSESDGPQDIFRQPTRRELLGTVVVFVALGTLIAVFGDGEWSGASLALGGVIFAGLALLAVVALAVESWLVNRGASSSSRPDDDA